MDTLREYTWPVSKKLVGRITEVFSQRSTKVLDPFFSQKKEKPKKKKLKQATNQKANNQHVWKNESKVNIYNGLLSIPDHKDANLVRLEKLNTSFPELLFRLVNCNSRLWPKMDSVSLKELSSFFISVFLGRKSLSDLEITIGMGGTELAPSVRIPIIIMPAIFLLEEIIKIKEEFDLEGSPKIHVFKSQNIAQDVNWINPEKASSATTLTFSFLTRYIERFHPSLLTYFDFTVDDWYTDVKDEIIVNAERSQQAAKVSWHLDSILKMWDKHGGEKWKEKALYYAWAHPIYNWFLDTWKTLNWHIRSNKKWLNINLWWFSERVFNWTMRQLGNDPSLKFNPTVFMVFDKMRLASYYPARKWDVGLNDYDSFKDVTLETFDPLVRNDIETILSDANLTLRRYLEFIRK